MARSWFPQWQKKSALTENGIIAPDETLPLGQTLVLGLQHAVAMFGATVLMPLLMGLDPNLAILVSGIGTLLFFFITGGRVPSYLGSSAAFVGVVIAVTGFSGQGLNPNLSVALGGVIACGLLYTLIGLVVMKSGTRWIENLMPAGRDRCGGDGYRAESGPDCGSQRLRLVIRQLGCGDDRALHWSGSGIYPRDDSATADSGRPDSGLGDLCTADQRSGAG
ncbi:Putative pyrimidine permease RutG [Pantoea agglomerans]|uniref:Pyrimidine permease RutG n=1 Tax=Enterobacter agglomerans TaxID=549 RepID=A0A379AHX3_ENTAG|nr:Putative pyrimidine permease RutG [Pantoea agglomerans]